VHRTWFERDLDGVWRRLDRASLGLKNGGAIRLAPAAETLLIGEGIESTLSGMQVFDLPGWSAIDAGNLCDCLELPRVVRSVLVAADHDRSGAGQAAAVGARRRWTAEGRSVRIVLPNAIGDFNDIIAGRIGR
jgi:putative DNA primase/helicase